MATLVVRIVVNVYVATQDADPSTEYFETVTRKADAVRHMAEEKMHSLFPDSLVESELQ